MFNQAIKKASLQLLQNKYQEDQDKDSNAAEILLTDEQILLLTEKVSAFPIEYKTVLFFYYCFGFSAKDTGSILQIENIAGKLNYLQRMLSFFMGLECARIDFLSMKKACQPALSEYIAWDDLVALQNPHYSDCFRKRLKKINAAQKPPKIIYLVAKRVAVFVLLCIIAFSMTIAANAQLREQFFYWVVDTFSQYSVFSVRDASSCAQSFELELYKINYIPQGYHLLKTMPGRTGITYEYSNTQNQRITVTIMPPSNIKLYMNTESATINEISFKDSPAFWWARQEHLFFIWQQDEIIFRVIAETGFEEVRKIAENIIK